MPARNAGPFIGAAIATTLRSMRAEDELLVLDDASTDDTRDIVSAVQDPRVVLYHSDHPLGVAESLNTLIEAASGDFIARMDADDLCMPWRFARQLRQLRNSGLDLVFSTPLLLYKIKFLSIVLWFPIFPVSTDQFARWGREVNFGIHPSAFGKSELFKRLKYAKVPDEDHDLWARAITANFKVRRYMLPSVVLRQHPHQVTKDREWLSAMKTKASIDQPSSKLPLHLRVEVFGPRRVITTVRMWGSRFKFFRH